MEPIQIAALNRLRALRQKPLRRRCVVLGAGPSLAHAPLPTEDDCVIAVNRAIRWCVGRRHADVWVLRDAETFADNHMTGWYNSVCMPSHHHAAIAPWMADRHIYDPDPWRCLYGSNYSLPDAFPMAYLLGYSCLLMYGVDWSGEYDFEGNRDTAGRTPCRWQKERNLVIAVSDALGMSWFRF